MPTGFTSKIIDGEIKTFPEFAKICMRAFGATIHMRDESLEKKYEPRTPGNYHTSCIESSLREKRKIEKQSNEDIEFLEKQRLENSIKENVARLKKVKKEKETLTKILNDAIKWNPPTEEHQNFKRFMMNQLEETIKHDCDWTIKYYGEDNQRMKESLKNIDGKIIKKEKLARIKEELEYHKKEQEKELQLCKESNEWVEILIKSVEKLQTTKK